jgi:hypothetical protein
MTQGKCSGCLAKPKEKKRKGGPGDWKRDDDKDRRRKFPLLDPGKVSRGIGKVRTVRWTGVA